ncbi:MAG: cytochrome B [Rhodospirillaceae bacterium]|nr:cytochrome B [Rhodospirillaceae bacterium]
MLLRNLYDRTMQLAAHPHAIWWLAGIALIESIFFPIPPDVLIIPMVLAARAQAWRIVTVATMASVFGGLIGYGIGYFAYESIVEPMIQIFPNYGSKYNVFHDCYQIYGGWVVGIGGFSPIPYKVITVASGLAQHDVVTFAIVSFISRGARFLIIAGLLWKFGSQIRAFIESKLTLLTAIFVTLLIGGFIFFKILFGASSGSTCPF